jgi:hypothetical protein
MATAMPFLLTALLCEEQRPPAGRLESVERVYSFEDDGACTVTQTFRERPLIESGRTEAAGIAQAYKPEYTHLRLDYCRILKSDGTQFSVDTLGAKDISVKDAGMTDGAWMAKALGIPSLEAGDVIEYRFTEWTKKLLKPGDFWR